MDSKAVDVVTLGRVALRAETKQIRDLSEQFWSFFKVFVRVALEPPNNPQKANKSIRNPSKPIIRVLKPIISNHGWNGSITRIYARTKNLMSSNWCPNASNRLETLN